MTTKLILVDGLQVETTEAGAVAIKKLQDALATSTASIADLTKAHDTVLAARDAIIAAKDKELAAKDAALDAANAKIVSDADLDKRVAARSALIENARSVAKDLKTDGLSDAAIRKAAVVAVLGDAVVAGKTETYIDARFEILVEDAAKNGGNGGGNNDAFRDARQHNTHVTNDAEKIRLASEAADRDAWRPKAVA